MKSFIAIVSSILVITTFIQCGSAQKLDKNAPFSIKSAYYQNWFGGRGASKGTIVSIEFSKKNSKKIIFDSIFFKGKTVKIQHTFTDSKQLIKGNFVTYIYRDKEVIMDIDPQKEMANKVPDITVNFPFELADKECVISYIIKNKKHYYKLKKLKEEQPIYYP